MEFIFVFDKPPHEVSVDYAVVGESGGSVIRIFSRQSFSKKIVDDVITQFPDLSVEERIQTLRPHITLRSAVLIPRKGKFMIESEGAQDEILALVAGARTLSLAPVSADSV